MMPPDLAGVGSVMAGVGARHCCGRADGADEESGKKDEQVAELGSHYSLHRGWTSQTLNLPS